VEGLPTIRDSFALWRLSPEMVRIFLRGCPLHSDVGGMPPLVFCRAGLIVDKLGVQL
jgi:hypothetical protein